MEQQLLKLVQLLFKILFPKLFPFHIHQQEYPLLSIEILHQHLLFLGTGFSSSYSGNTWYIDRVVGSSKSASSGSTNYTVNFTDGKAMTVTIYWSGTGTGTTVTFTNVSKTDDNSIKFIYTRG